MKRLEAAFQGGNDLHDGQDDLLQNEELRSMIMCHRQQYGREQQVHSASAEREATVDGDSLSQVIRLLMDDHRGAETERQAAEDRKTTLQTEHEALRRQIVQVEAEKDDVWAQIDAFKSNMEALSEESALGTPCL